MKRLLVLLYLIPLATAHAVEKPFQTSNSISLFVPHKENPFYCSEIKIPLIDKNRVIILPEVYQADVTQLKELFTRLLNPEKIENEGGLNIITNKLSKTPYDIVALKKIAAYFPVNAIINRVCPKVETQEKKTSLLDTLSNLFISPKQNMITFCAPDRDNNHIHQFDIALPTTQRHIELAPISLVHMDFIKTRLYQLYNMGIEDDIEPLPLAALHEIAQLQ